VPPVIIDLAMEEEGTSILVLLMMYFSYSHQAKPDSRSRLKCL